MTGGALIAHSWRMISSDPVATLRVVLVPWLVMTLATFAVGDVTIDVGDAEAATAPLAGSTLLVLILVVACWLWMAIAWHRYALTGEQPRGWVPAFNASRALSYLGRALLVSLPVIPVILVAALVFAPFFSDDTGSDGFGGGLVFSMFLSAVFAYISFRFGPYLPAVAMGRPVAFGQAWRSTTPQNAAILQAALITALCLLPFELLAMAGNGGVLVVAFTTIGSDLVGLLSLSVLTTLYGVLIEGRSLPIPD